MSDDKAPGPETAETMQAIARSLDLALNGRFEKRKFGFAFFVFEFDKPQGSRTNYASNADRSAMIVALKEVIARWEGQAEVSGRA